MSAGKVFDTIARRFPEVGVEFLMIGGHAVNHYGYVRATMDVDFMIAASDVERVRRVMKAAGFTNISEAENVIFFSEPGSSLRVDFLPVDAETMAELLSRSEQVGYMDAVVRVPSLEDLIAMKLFALHNGPEKRLQRDGEDVVQLVLENRMELETGLKPLCLQFADKAVYRKLKERIGRERHA